VLKFLDFLERLDAPVPEKPRNWWVFLSMRIPGFRDKTGSAYYLKVKQAWILVLSCFPRFSGLSGVKKACAAQAGKPAFLCFSRFSALFYMIAWVISSDG